MAELSSEQIAYQAKEVKLLISHEAWPRAVAETEQRIVEEWRDARNPLDREMCWHKLKAFETLLHELRALTDPSPGNGRLALRE